jgi:hypothetical protein
MTTKLGQGKIVDGHAEPSDARELISSALACFRSTRFAND